MSVNKSSFPYYDDYDSSKGYHRIMFHPAKPVQARELTQMQTILQEQIKRHGDHIFKNGTMVLPGHVFYDNKVKYLKLETTYNQINVTEHLDDLIGKTIIGDSNDITAMVVHAQAATDADPTLLFIKYTSANGSIQSFTSGETLTCPDIAGLILKVQPVTDFSGKSAICSIDQGVYYMNGYFVEVLKQTVTVSKYTDIVTSTVGLEYVESIVTENEDDTLNDNAFGFTNYGAPGAHRLKIALNLVVKDASYTSEDSFIELIKISSGNVLLLNNNTKYSEIEKLLARRTSDESGDYIVDTFRVIINEYRQNHRGGWTANTPYLQGDIVTSASKTYVAKTEGYSGVVAPAHTFGIVSDGVIEWQNVSFASSNNGAFTINSNLIADHKTAESKLSVLVSPGKAYIQGFEVEVSQPTRVIVNKARTQKQVITNRITGPSGNFIYVENMLGVPSILTIPKCNLKDSTNATIGTAFVKNVEYVSGTIGSADIYKVFLFGISMYGGKQFFVDVHKITDGASFTADVRLTKYEGAGVVATTASSAVLTGTSTQFLTDFSVGQEIEVGAETKLILSIESQTSLTANSNFASTSTDMVAIGHAAYLFGSSPYIIPLPNDNISSVRDEDGLIDIQYKVSKYFTFTTSGTTKVLTSSHANESFDDAGHIVYDVTNNVIVDAGYALNGNATQLTISGLANATNYQVIAVLNEIGPAAKEKTKRLMTKTITITNAGTYDETNSQLTSNTVSAETVKLTEADVTRIIKVTESQDANFAIYSSTNEVNITNDFKLNVNATLEAYMESTLSYKTNNVQQKPIRVTFEYFEHSTGDYFSINSYANVKYEDIPYIGVGDYRVPLRTCLDFRARMADDGSGFSAAGASVPSPIMSASPIVLSYSYYLPRTDMIVLSPNGKLQAVVGTPADTTQVPMIGETDLPIAVLKYAPYTSMPAFVDVQYMSHKRYTMKDIGRIDARLQNVEYYVSLNELEKETAAAKFVDANGLERFKNGFVADNFTDLSMIDQVGIDVRATLDDVEQTLNPWTIVDMVPLTEGVNITPEMRAANGYATMGNYLTVAYTEMPIISQLLSSRAENVNPFAVFSWSGKLKLTPNSDNWVETRTDVNRITR